MSPACRAEALWRCVHCATDRTALSSQPGRVAGVVFPVKNCSNNFPAVHGRWRRRRVIDYDLSEHSSGITDKYVIMSAAQFIHELEAMSKSERESIFASLVENQEWREDLFDLMTIADRRKSRYAPLTKYSAI